MSLQLSQDFDIAFLECVKEVATSVVIHVQTEGLGATHC